MKKTTLTNILKILAAVALLFWMIKSDKIDIEALRQVASWEVLTISMGIVGFTVWMASERWRILLAVNVGQFNRWLVFKLTCIGIFFNFAMPGGVGGDMVKGYYLVKGSENRTHAIAGLLMDRIVGLYCMLLAAVMVMTVDIQHVLATPKLKLIFATMTGAWMVGTLFFVLALSNRTHVFTHNLLSKISFVPGVSIGHKLFRAFTQFSEAKKSILYSGFISAVTQFSSIFLFYFIGNKLGFGQLEFYKYFIIVPVGFIVTALPLTPGGVGIGQAAFYFLFELYSPGTGVVGSTGITTLQLMQFIIGLFGAWIFIRAKHHLDFNSSTSTSTFTT